MLTELPVEGVNTSFVLLPILLFVGMLALLIPILIGRYVYKDAKSRNMDAVLWTLVAVFVPGLIGLLIYLVVRGSSAGLSCPGCQKPVTSEYTLCPYCGRALKASCPSCAAPVDNAWRMCPKCGTALPAQNTPAASVPIKKDRTLMWILLIALVVPLLVLLIGIGGMISFRDSGTSTSSVIGLDLAYNDVPEYVTDWIKDCDARGKGVYVLKLSADTVRTELLADDLLMDGYNGEIYDDVFYAYIYVNKYKSTEPRQSFGGGGGVSYPRKAIEVYYETTEVSSDMPDYELSKIIQNGHKVKRLDIFIDGVNTDYILKEIG